MRIESIFACGELRQSSDGCFQVGGVRRKVTDKLVNGSIGRCTTHIWETSLTSLIPVDRVISAASALYLSHQLRVNTPVARHVPVEF